MGVQVPLPAPTQMKIEYNPNEDKETTLIERFGLIKYSEVYNRPYDAIDQYGNYFELKSTSKSSVSTARDMSINHIIKWRKVNWIVGFWDRKTSTYEMIFLLRPQEMKEWLDMMEASFKEMENLSNYLIKQCENNSDVDISLLQRILRRGCTKNDPNIPNSYIIRNGIPITTSDDLYSVLERNEIPKVGLQEFMEFDND